MTTPFQVDVCRVCKSIKELREASVLSRLEGNLRPPDVLLFIVFYSRQVVYIVSASFRTNVLQTCDVIAQWMSRRWLAIEIYLIMYEENYRSGTGIATFEKFHDDDSLKQSLHFIFRINEQIINIESHGRPSQPLKVTWAEKLVLNFRSRFYIIIFSNYCLHYSAILCFSLKGGRRANEGNNCSRFTPRKFSIEEKWSAMKSHD